MRGFRPCDMETSLHPHPTFSPSGRGSEVPCSTHGMALLSLRAAVLWAAALCLLYVAARAEPVEEFFAGRQIKFVNEASIARTSRHVLIIRVHRGTV